MEYILIILIGTVIIWTTYFAIRAIENKREHDIPDSPIPNMPLKVGSAKTQQSIKVQKTDDILYAESKKMWICPHCETLNETLALRCAACGYPKS